MRECSFRLKALDTHSRLEHSLCVNNLYGNYN